MHALPLCNHEMPQRAQPEWSLGSARSYDLSVRARRECWNDARSTIAYSSGALEQLQESRRGSTILLRLARTAQKVHPRRRVGGRVSELFQEWYEWPSAVPVSESEGTLSMVDQS